MEVQSSPQMSRSAPRNPKVWLVRHGERCDFVDPDWKEQAARPFDPNLSDHGYIQAQHLAERFQQDEDISQVKHILCSPYIRCIETIYPLASALGLSIKIEHGLTEWFGTEAEVTEDHLPLSTEELHQLFPLVDPTYTPHFQISFGKAGDREVHQRLYNVAHHVSHRYYMAEKYEGDVILVTHAAVVITGTRGFLALRNNPEELDPSWYCEVPRGPGRFNIPSPVCCLHKLSQINSSHLEWEHLIQGDASHLPDQTRNYDWKFKADR